MNKIVILRDWPQPSGVPEPQVFSDDYKVVLRYTTSDDAVAIIVFPIVNLLQYGWPNDEALNGHPLYKNGLEFYSVHRVESSSKIEELERSNSVHPQHDKGWFLRDKTHYIFTFQDSTLECIVTEGERGKPVIRICASTEEADRIWEEATCN